MKKFFSLITALVLCTAMWGAATYKTFYKVQGALYQGINVDFTTNKNMFVPNGATVTYSTFDGKPADWWANGKQKKTNVSYITIPDLADANYYKYQIKNYTGYDAQDPKIDYIYGTSSGDYLLRAGSGTMYMMSMANAYCVCTESTTASNVGKYYVDNKSMLTLSTADAKTYGTSMKYGTNFSYAKNGGLIDGYEMLLDNPGEMYIDYIVLPIFGYPKADTTTIAKMIPEGKKLTLTLYPIDLTLGSDGIYTYTRKTTAITSVTATAENFKQGDKVYDGTVKFDLSNNPLLISGDFVARLTWDEGCEFGLITDDNNLQNFTTFYLWKKEDGTFTKSYMWSSSSANASISYHAMFPVLEKKDTKTALEFTHEGGGDEVAIKSNINPSSEDFTIDFGGADWISLDSLRYTTEGKYVAKETVYVVFKAEANTGEAREATITLKHHGKVLTYTVSQEAAPAPALKTIYCKMEHNWWKVDGAAVGCHYWGTPGPGTTWPGVRMTPVEGQADLWSIELDLNQVQNVIFTRVNGSGAIADWGAKTKDLTIPTDDKNLFTITTSSESWGDPGCDGEWSVYGGAVEKPKHDYTITAYLPAFCDDIAAYADSVRVMGGFDDWSNGIWMEEKIDEDFNEYWYAEIKDVEEDTEFKLRFGTDADWKVQVQLNGANMANEAFGETTDIVLHYDGEGYGFAACAAPAARKEFVFVAGEAADSDPALFAITWGKDGSNETVKLANKADDIYTAEILETVDSLVLVRCATGATEIIWDGEGMNVWNQTANYALCDTMYFGGWTEEGLFTLTCEAPKPVETKYYAKNNWNGGEWSWKEMAKKEDLYVLDSVVFGGTGVNINTKEEDADAKWFDLKKMKYNEQDTIQALDTVRFELAISEKDTVLTAILLGRPAPAPRKEFTFIAGEAADSDPALFAITWGKDGSNETVKLANKADDIYTANILETVDSVVLVRCASDATEIIWDGEGKNVWNQTANYELCDTMYFESWVEETNLFAVTCEAPKPVETKYYAKNNWNGAEDWSWLEMSATDQENIYMLDSVVFGGMGVNINDKEDDTDALYFAADSITVLDGLDGLPGPIPPEPRKRDTIPYAPAHSGVVLEAPQLLAGDTIKLFFNAADSTLKAAIVGRPAPAPRKEFTFIAGEAADSDPALFAITWGKDGSNETVKLANKADDIYTAEILETVDSLVLVRCATGATEIIWDGEGKNVWNQTANYALCDTMYFESWVPETNLFAVTCEAPKPVEVKYYVTGNAALVGEEKAWQADAIEMVDYTHTFSMLAAGEYQLKVTDGTWEHAWGYDNLSPTVAVEGLYTDVDGNICFTVYTPNDVTVTFAQGYVVVTGDFTNPTPATPDFGLLVNGTDYLPGTPEDKDTYTEYAVNKQLTVGEFVQLYDNVNKAAWTVTPEGSGFTDFEMKNDAYYIKQAGLYQFYIKIPKEGMESGLYVGFQGSGTGLNNVKAQDGKRYNILGLPVNETYRGIVIMNGQTYLQ